MTKLKKYNKRNWYTNVVHAANPMWPTIEDIPKERWDPRSQTKFYAVLCGADKLGGRNFNAWENPLTGQWKGGRHDQTFCLTCVREVTCKRCLRLMDK